MKNNDKPASDGQHKTKLEILKEAFKAEEVKPDKEAEKVFAEVADRLLCLGVLR